MFTKSPATTGGGVGGGGGLLARVINAFFVGTRAVCFLCFAALAAAISALRRSISP